MSKKASYILILSLVVITVIGIFIGVWSYASQDKLANEKTIVLDEQPQTKMEVNLSGICPGVSTSYKIHLRANTGDAFNITMDFEKTAKDTLAKFIDVEIRLNGKKIDSAKLSELLGGRQIAFPAAFNGKTEVDIEIVYSMGLDVGDEAQNTTADFNILLTAKR